MNTIRYLAELNRYFRKTVWLKMMFLLFHHTWY